MGRARRLGHSFGSPSVAAQVLAAGHCLAVDLDRLDEATTSAVVGSVQDALATRPVLIPALSIVGPDPTAAESPDATIRLAMWTNGAAEPMAAPDVPGPDAGQKRWTRGPGAPRSRAEFLRAGTKRELAAAGTTPGFTSDIDVEWSEADDLVRTVLTFSGPLGIPNGTCWMDDVVSADGQGGTHAETTTDFGDQSVRGWVCGRFEEYLGERRRRRPGARPAAAGDRPCRWRRPSPPRRWCRRPSRWRAPVGRRGGGTLLARRREDRRSKAVRCDGQPRDTRRRPRRGFADRSPEPSR